MVSSLSRRLAAGQAGSKVNGAVGLAALPQHMVVIAGGWLDDKGAGLQCYVRVKGKHLVRSARSPLPHLFNRSER